MNKKSYLVHRINTVPAIPKNVNVVFSNQKDETMPTSSYEHRIIETPDSPPPDLETPETVVDMLTEIREPSAISDDRNPDEISHAEQETGQISDESVVDEIFDDPPIEDRDPSSIGQVSDNPSPKRISELLQPH